MCVRAQAISSKKEKKRVGEGDCVELYKKLFLHKDTEEMIGQVMCDQMKVKADVAFNVKNDEVMGFTKDFASIKKIVKNLLDDSTLEIEN